MNDVNSKVLPMYTNIWTHPTCSHGTYYPGDRREHTQHGIVSVHTATYTGR